MIREHQRDGIALAKPRSAECFAAVQREQPANQLVATLRALRVDHPQYRAVAGGHHSTSPLRATTSMASPAMPTSLRAAFDQAFNAYVGAGELKKLGRRLEVGIP